MRRSAVLALLVGCYSPSIVPGAPCETECPGDLVCIEHVCREPGYVPRVDAALTDAFVAIDTLDGPPGDADADAVPDATDNCPAKTNSDQHDEDGDLIGDVCDPCPHLAGTADDGDGDGVGDACDPQPAVAKQRIRFFDPFTADLPEWTQKYGFSRVGETLRLDGASYAGTDLLVPASESRIAMAGTIAGLTPNASEHQLTLAFGHNGTDTIYYYTEFYDPGSGPGEIAITRANNGVYTSIATTAYSGVLPLGAWSMRTDVSVATQRIAFASTLGGTPRASLNATVGTPALTASTKLELYVSGVDVRLDYFIVIETLP